MRNAAAFDAAKERCVKCETNPNQQVQMRRDELQTVGFGLDGHRQFMPIPMRKVCRMAFLQPGRSRLGR
jgi:hypothetical protein